MQYTTVDCNNSIVRCCTRVVQLSYLQDDEETPPESGKDNKDEGQKDEAAKETQSDSEKSPEDEKLQEKKEETDEKKEPTVRMNHFSVTFVK